MCASVCALTILPWSGQSRVFFLREAVASSATNAPTPECQNTLRLFVAGPKSAVGFSLSGKTIVTAGPYFDVGEDSPRKNSCTQKEDLWVIDPVIPTISQLPDNYKIQCYGKDAP
jgi:hypothetical protein